MTSSSVVAVSRKATHGPDKPNCAVIRMVAGCGVEGDAHFGATVKHRSRVARDPTQPNLRQVHLIHAELHDELLERGFQVRPGLMGENITTRGVDLLGLCRGAMLRIGPEVVVQITGLRNPCYQLDELQPGLMAACLGRDSEGNPVRKAGVMGVIITGGQVAAGDAILVELPAGPQEVLKPV
ncbi:MOSC domain-containing protein [Phenylobacterium sp.]|jgi:MOSC domain-containing protein YiiM|uniref:MOSC domain-containing protein n=1 Tax=Phenylobacterium sp. TaxID=1871053 RepID=UPI0037C92EAA